MFAVLYRFTVCPGKNEEFIKAWEEMTMLIREYEGSGGSRLHHAEDDVYIAYALWPVRSVWEDSGKSMPPEAKEVRERMRGSCISIDTIYELEVVKDLLD